MVSFHHSTTIQYLSVVFATFCVWNTPKCNGKDTTFNGNGQDTFGSSYFFYQQPTYPRDCKELRNQCETSNTSGVYMIKPDGYSQPFEVFCNNKIDSGGWTVIQRRMDGSVTFNRNWEEYKDGFGFLSSEFWIGNEKLSYLTNQADHVLRVDMMLSNGSSFFIEYNTFRITDEWGVYTLVSVGTYSGNADSVITYCPPNTVYDGNNCLQPTSDPPEIFTDCYDAYLAGHQQDGVFNILPSGWTGPAFDVPCNMSIDGGGWTVLQRRVNGSVNFERDWDGYKNGFGIPGHELWLGNDKIYYITNQRNYLLRMDMVNLDGNAYFAKYSLFRITDEDSNYKLEDLGTYDSSSTTGYDAMNYHRDRFFSTTDRDNDDYSDNCAAIRRSAWWYGGCNRCDFNRPQLGGGDGFLSPYWLNLPGSDYLLYADIKIRPV